MRGALKPFGVKIEGLLKDKADFTVRFDPGKVTSEQLLAALAEKKKPGKLKPQ